MWFWRKLLARISQSVRSHDIVIRFGGDEFLVMLHDTTHEEAKKIARRIARPEKKTLMVNREELPCRPFLSVWLTLMIHSSTVLI
ncbi:putative diguanylate cyclase [Enterobacter cancerogenus]|uniref:Putative diguanylate cyclase n=1 Tax=Enterobacter cancerogenus TaxID=69218 RepID=A0A484YRB3_9ENTR|nr:putative diguanylate cyclase [Enterobacter cancerogenus]